MAAGGERASVDDRLPEEARGAAIALLARQLVEPLEADDLRDLRVGVQAVERVAPFGERREQRLVAEAAGERQVLRVAGQRRDVGEHLVHAAVLGAEHALELLVGHRRCRRGRPVRELRQHVERRGAAGVQVRVAQAARRSCASCTRARRRTAGPRRRSRAARRRRGTRRRARFATAA